MGAPPETGPTPHPPHHVTSDPCVRSENLTTSVTAAPAAARKAAASGKGRQAGAQRTHHRRLGGYRPGLRGTLRPRRRPGLVHLPPRRRPGPGHRRRDRPGAPRHGSGLPLRPGRLDRPPTAARPAAGAGAGPGQQRGGRLRHRRPPRRPQRPRTGRGAAADQRARPALAHPATAAADAAGRRRQDHQRLQRGRRRGHVPGLPAGRRDEQSRPRPADPAAGRRADPPAGRRLRPLPRCRGDRHVRAEHPRPAHLGEPGRTGQTPAAEPADRPRGDRRADLVAGLRPLRPAARCGDRRVHGPGRAPRPAHRSGV